MKMNKFLIAGGNPTLLVWDCPENKKEKVIKNQLSKVEQVGFVSYGDDGIPKLSMMGNELCINATLAFASVLNGMGVMMTSGLNSTVFYKNDITKTTIIIKLKYSINNNIVCLPGIGFIFTKRKRKQLKTLLSRLSGDYNLPAFGLVCTKNSQIEPYIYVKQTNSLIKETACGSASIALNLLKNTEEVIQPTGNKILIRRDGNSFTVTTNIKRINFLKGGDNYE